MEQERMEQDIDIFDTEDELQALKTDRDHEQLFMKVAEHYELLNFSSLQEKVAELFDNKLDDQLSRWEDKLVLDRNLLKQVFTH